MKREKILVTGANGQIGRVLTKALRERFGQHNVLASDISKIELHNEPFEFLDILNTVRLKELIDDQQITQIYHMAAILSASGEWNPMKTWNINMNGFLSILEIAKEKGLSKLFFPSTIAVFGNTTPQINTAQDVPLLPETVYGISKATGELWSNYYFKKFNVDCRSIRYPGIIGYQSLPSGGTTDYAVEIYHAAVKGETYKCFLNEATRLPMMYMPDAIRATINLMEAPKESIVLRYGYNLSAMSFTPAEIASSIKAVIPDFKIVYEPDQRQQIAASWSESIDDTRARNDWGWNPKYDLDLMTKDMIKNLREQYNLND